MNNVYIIYHKHDVACGLDDSISQCDVVGCVSTKEEAIRWCKAYEDPHIYRYHPRLTCGIYFVREYEIVDSLPYIPADGHLIYETEYIPMIKKGEERK